MSDVKYEYEIYNGFIDEIYDEYCKFSTEEIDANPRYCFGMMGIGVRKLRNYLTEEDRRPSTSSIKTGTLLEVMAASDEDARGIPHQTFRYRDKVLQKVEDRLAELADIYNINLKLNRHKESKRSGRKSRRWEKQNQHVEQGIYLAYKYLKKNADARTGEIVNAVRESLKQEGVIYTIKTIRSWLVPILPESSKRPGRPKGSLKSSSKKKIYQ